MPLRLYLDNCCIHRPADDRAQLRVAVEITAVLSLVDAISSGSIELISSDILHWEAANSHDPLKQSYARGILDMATIQVKVDAGIVREASKLSASGLHAIDALHLACAAAGRADFLCTCDDQLIKRAAVLELGRLKVVSPLRLIEEYL